MAKLDHGILDAIFDLASGRKTRGRYPELSKRFFGEVADQEPMPVDHLTVLKAIYGKEKARSERVKLCAHLQTLRGRINKALEVVYGSGNVYIDNRHGKAWQLLISDDLRHVLSDTSEADIHARLKAWQGRRGRPEGTRGRPEKENIPTIEDLLKKVPNSEFIRRFRLQRHRIVARIYEEYALDIDTETRKAFDSVNVERRSQKRIPYYASMRFRLVHPPTVTASEVTLDLAPINYACCIMVEDPGVPPRVKRYTQDRIKDIARRMPSSFRTSHPILNAYNPVPLGIHTVIITKEGKTLMRKRGRSVSVSKDAWGVAVGGYCGNDDRVENTLDVGLTVENELRREIGTLTADPRDMLFTGFHRNRSTRSTSILGFWRLEGGVDELVSVLTDKYPGEMKVFKTTRRTEENFVLDFKNIIVDFQAKGIVKALVQAGSSISDLVPECLVALMFALEANGQSFSDLFD